jgi:hypothetical protein
MQYEHPERPLTDEALDREVSRALAVDPSPEFVARIRQRLASGPAPAAWRVSWTVYAGTFAAAAAAIVLVVVSRDTPPATLPLTARPIPAIGRLAEVAPALSHSLDRGEIRSVSPRVPSLSKNPRQSDPEIIIDVREASALRALIAGASHERVDVAPLVTLAAKAAALLQSPEIVVSPITIEPLAPGPGGEGARQ